MLNSLNITVIGGSGFVGRYVVRHLARAGARIRVVCRNPEAALFLKTAGDPGQIVLVKGDITRPDTLESAIKGADAIVNLAGILFETGRQRFNAVQSSGAEAIARLAAKHNCARVIHVSALGIDKAFGSDYARTKLMGEKALLSAFPAATILRPGVIFGTEDNFLNRFAVMPFLPLIGGGTTRFQPVYVDDVAKAITACLADPATAGQTYELGGATTYTFRALMKLINHATGRHRRMISLPFPIASLIALASELAFRTIPLISAPALTRDQVKLLKHDNILTQGTKGFAELGITPQPLEAIAPRILSRFSPKKGG